MKKIFMVLLVPCFGSSPSASAQQAIPPLQKEFLDSAFAVLPSEVGARYRRETQYTDSVAGTVKTYFLTGQIRNIQSFDNIRKGSPHGTFESWFANGQLSTHAEYAHGKSIGELRMYYSNGQLKRRELYITTNSFGSTGQCFAENGQPVPFFKFEQMPIYPEGDGGSLAVIRAIQRRVKYPRDALKAKQAGRVFVSFTVTNTGEVANIKVVKSVFPSIDIVVVEAVQQLKRFVPGQQDGQPVAVSFTVPVTFSIP
jgi:protein TonB